MLIRYSSLDRPASYDAVNPASVAEPTVPTPGIDPSDEDDPGAGEEL
jgi:hypothetical protein